MADEDSKMEESCSPVSMFHEMMLPSLPDEIRIRGSEEGHSSLETPELWPWSFLNGSVILRRSQRETTELRESLEAVARRVELEGEKAMSDNDDLNVESAKLWVERFERRSQTTQRPVESQRPKMDDNVDLGCHETAVISPWTTRLVIPDEHLFPALGFVRSQIETVLSEDIDNRTLV